MRNPYTPSISLHQSFSNIFPILVSCTSIALSAVPETENAGHPTLETPRPPRGLNSSQNINRNFLAPFNSQFNAEHNDVCFSACKHLHGCEKRPSELRRRHTRRLAYDKSRKERTGPQEIRGACQKPQRHIITIFNQYAKEKRNNTGAGEDASPRRGQTRVPTACQRPSR